MPTATPIITLSADRGIPKAKLDKLAQQTGLALANPKTPANFLLHLTTDQLELRKVEKPKTKNKKHNKNPLTIAVNFTQGKSQHRRLHGGGKGQDIAKAIGLHKLDKPTVLDVSAGMGGDAFMLASLGATLTLLERNPIVHALLHDALTRLQLIADPELQAIHQRLTLIKTDAIDYLNALDTATKPDVIYLDPMFPSRSKSAQVKKEMQFFHDIVGADDDSEHVLLLALNKAQKRIVVKRPRLAEKLTDTVQPAFEIVGKSTRFDVYLPQKDEN